MKYLGDCENGEEKGEMGEASVQNARRK
ncbi:unnamed protein product, partial [Allacma fusca]